MKLLASVTVNIPETCDTCPFGFIDSDEGEMCCGKKRGWFYKVALTGHPIYSYVQSPKEALEYGCECMFVSESN